MRPANFSCPFCGSSIRVAGKKNIPNHLNPGGVRCFAVGISTRAAINLRRERDLRRAA
jgi:hypothetical protein